MGISQVVLLTVSTVHPIPSHPIMYPNVPGTEWEHPKLYHPPCLNSYCPFHPNVPWEGRDEVGTSQTVPPLMPAFLLSIPSQCTIGRKGWSGNIPNCTTPYACIPTVHPIPMYHGKEGMEWEHPKLYHPPSAFLLSIPSQCTIGRKGWSGNMPNCTTPHVCIPTVHPIPMYHGKEEMEWEHPKLYHSPCLHFYCPSHPNVPWEGRDGVGTSQTVPPLMPASPLSIPSQCTMGRKGQSGNIPHCTTHHLYSYCPSHPNVPWEGRDGVGTSQTVPLPMPAFLLSIPSQCTVGRKGWSGNIPNCTTPYACIPTVHPIPMYHGKEGMEWEHLNLNEPALYVIYIIMMHTE